MFREIFKFLTANMQIYVQNHVGKRKNTNFVQILNKDSHFNFSCDFFIHLQVILAEFFLFLIKLNSFANELKSLDRHAHRSLFKKVASFNQYIISQNQKKVEYLVYSLKVRTRRSGIFF